MTTYSLAGAASRLLTISVDGFAPGHNRPGMCLRWCYYAAGLTPERTPANVAMDVWNYAPASSRHPIGPNTVVPKDAAIILGPSPTRTDGNRNAGDVIFAYEQGVGLSTRAVMTDAPSLGSGRIGIATIAQRAAQTQRPVLGYVTKWLGYDLAVGTSPAAGGGTTPITPTTPKADPAMSVTRIIKNNTVGDKDYGSKDVVNIEDGFWWHCPNDQYVEMWKLMVGRNVEEVPANIWNFYRSLAANQRAAIGNAVWASPVVGANGSHQAGARLVGADLKSGTASLTISNSVADSIAKSVVAGVKSIFARAGA